jgi:hypothetical protein
MIAISCPACANTGKVPTDFAGKTVRCPKCRGKIQVPMPDGASTVPAQSSKPGIGNAPAKSAVETRCPFCNELIQAAAKKCKHCGEWLDAAQGGEKPQSKAPSGPVDLSSYVTPGSTLPVPVLQPQQPDSAFNFDSPNQPVASGQELAAESSGFHCPFCKTTSRPIVKSQVSTAGWIMFILLLVLLCWPLCWIGLFIKEDYRVCSACGIKLG